MKNFLFAIPLLLAACTATPDYDLIIRNGTVYDGTGNDPVVADVAVTGDRIIAIGDLTDKKGARELDATGKAVAPGFINMLSWAPRALMRDGRSMSDIMQGVTLEVFGEGESMGPLNTVMKEEMAASLDLETLPWTSLGEYLEYMENKGISTNIASFVGATTLRIHEVGYEDRPPTPDELDRMKQLTREAMLEGALGVGSSLIYAPAFYADTDELVALVSEAADLNGMYISHLRSEGNAFEEAVEELITIAERADARAEIYHLKAAGEENWPKMERVLARIDSLRAQGMELTADIYSYTAGATGLDASMPPWVQEGGYDAWVERLRDPAIRSRVLQEMRTPTNEWENLMLAAGDPSKVLFSSFRQDSLKYLTGKTLAEVSAMRGTSPEDTAIDLVIEDGSRVETIYFIMSEENMRAKISKPWVAVCSDAGSIASEGDFLNYNPHPRAYGSFARFLAKYVRDENVISMAEGIRRLTGLPAQTLRLTYRGKLAPQYFADIVVFDPRTIQDHATFAEPHQYATGITHVFVNGTLVVNDGEHTGALPGRVVRGPGWANREAE